jgi:hypothetical protein
VGTQDHDEIGASHADRQQGQTGSASHADSRSHPYRGCGSEPANEILPNKDDAAADESDARNNLSGDARRIENNTAGGQDVSEAIFRN